MRFYDISPLISPDSAVFPGDQQFEREVVMDFSKGDHLGLSWIRSTVHIGAHADAPNHYKADGPGIDERDLELYFGSCQVIHVTALSGERIGKKHVGTKHIKAPRVLVRTDSFPNPDHWNSDFNSLDPEWVQELSDLGVRLVGIDTPSVDPETSKALETHQVLARNDLAVLEGLVLTQVPEGLYSLVALPLKIRGADASPVRAVLFDHPDLWAR